MTESTDDRLRIEYVPLFQAALWDQNPKLHSIGDISDSIARYGFKDPPKYEPALNGGKGGLVEGNGRVITLRMMAAQKMQRPRGIVETEGGEWAVPVLFGVDAESERAAQAYALDHNSLVLSGGNYTALDTARMWDQSGYADILTALAEGDELPVSVDGDDLDLILEMVNQDVSGVTFPEYDESVANEVEWLECPECGHKWPK